MMRWKYILLVHCIVFVSPYHFYGGTVTWKPMVKNTTGSIISVMFTQSYQYQLGRISSTNCTQLSILTQSPKVGSENDQLQCVSNTNACGGYQNMSVSEYCTDYSTVINSTSGLIMQVENITAGSKFCVAYQGKDWTTLAAVACSSSGRRKKRLFPISSSHTRSRRTCSTTYASWSVGTCLDLSIRLDGFLNTAPVATVISPVRVPVNSLTNIKIPVIDADDDFLRCRWGEKTSELDECGDVCQTAPGGTVNSTDCSIQFNSTGDTVGSFYAVALMVEDFYNSTSTDALSSVPIQFLIEVIGSPNCSSKPVITTKLSECTAVEVGVQYNFSLTITPGCSGTTIVDVYTMPPLYTGSQN